MTIISIAGVIVGVAVLIIVLSVMGGFEHDLRNKMLRGQPHIEVLAANASLGFAQDELSPEEVLQAFPEATAVAPFTQGDVVAKHGKHLAAITLIGIDTAYNNSMWAFTDTVIDGKLEDINRYHHPLISMTEVDSKFPGIVLGEGVAGQLGVDIGDEITLLSPQAASGAVIFSGGTISRTYVVAGIFASLIFDYDSKWAVVSLAEGRKFMTDYDPTLDLEKYMSGIAVNISDPLQVDQLDRSLHQRPGFQLLTWQDTNSALLLALKLEKYTMGAILMLIVVVAAFSISGTMMMTVFHKKTQVCLLRSLGMTQRDIAKLYLVQGLVIGIVGVAIGAAVGIGSCYGILKLNQYDLSANLVSVRNLPVRFLPMEYCVIGGMALIFSLVGALYPALIASRQNPSSGLRYS